MTNLFPKPEMKGSWAIFKDVTFKPFLSPFACTDTIHGKCYNDKDLNQCIDICEKSEDCDAGYYVEFEDNNYCLPLTTSTYPYSNPSYHVKNKSLFETTKFANSTYFTNTKKFPYPEKKVNYVFISDLLKIKNVETNTVLSTKLGTPDKPLKFTKNDDTLFQPFYSHLDITYGYLTEVVRNMFIIIFSMVGNNILISTSDDFPNKLSYVAAFNWYMDPIKDGFKIICKDKEFGEPIVYGDDFYLQYKDSILGLNHKNELILYQDDIKNLLQKKTPITFSFVSDENVFYCNNNDKCKKVLLSKTTLDKNKLEATYKGKQVYRTKSCFGLCKTESNIYVAKSRNIFLITISVVILLLIIFIMKNK